MNDIRIEECISRYRDVPGGLLPMLHSIQHALGYVPADAVPAIATAINRSRAEVHGVLSFYHDFRETPPARHTVQICVSEACQANGADALKAHAEASLGVAVGHSSGGDGALEPVYCLGNCACGPSVRIGDAVHARVDADQFDALMAAMRQEA